MKNEKQEEEKETLMEYESKIENEKKRDQIIYFSTKPDYQKTSKNWW
jgi:hypothetical protein